jgi:DNA invertase Pin-like site-specific DNA recombinase
MAVVAEGERKMISQRTVRNQRVAGLRTDEGASGGSMLVTRSQVSFRSRFTYSRVTHTRSAISLSLHFR